MTTEVVMSFGTLQRDNERALEKMVRLVPALTAGLMQSCDVGVRSSARSLLLRLRLDGGPAAASAIARLAFWSARANGIAIALAGDLGEAASSVTAALDASDWLERDVSPRELPGTLGRAFAALWPMAPRVDVDPSPVLVVATRGRRRDRLLYDPRRRVLSIATPLALPLGDRFVLALPRRAPGREPVRGDVRVVEVQRLMQRSPGAGRFLLWLAVEEEALRAELRRAAARRPEPGSPYHRRAGIPRRVRFGYARQNGSVEEVASLSYLSLEGARVATERPPPVGSRLFLTMCLPGVGERSLRAIVEGVTATGMAIRFELDEPDEAALATAIAALSAKRHLAGEPGRDPRSRGVTVQPFLGPSVQVIPARAACASQNRLPRARGPRGSFAPRRAAGSGGVPRRAHARPRLRGRSPAEDPPAGSSSAPSQDGRCATAHVQATAQRAPEERRARAHGEHVAAGLDDPGRRAPGRELGGDDARGNRLSLLRGTFARRLRTVRP